MLGHSYEEYNYETFGAYSDNYANGAYPSSSFGLINSVLISTQVVSDIMHMHSNLISDVPPELG